MVNQQHGWRCPTCGSERSECDVGAGAAVLERPTPLVEPFIFYGTRLTDDELRARNSAMEASGRGAADEIRCTAPMGHRFAPMEGQPGFVGQCTNCGLVLLREPIEKSSPVTSGAPTIQDALGTPCDENHGSHWFRSVVSATKVRTGRVVCLHCGLEATER